MSTSNDAVSDVATSSRDLAVQRWADAFRSQTAYIPDAAPSTHSSPAIQSAWDDEIEGISRQLHVAKYKRNAFSLPCSLPTEVLAYIFELLVSSYRVYDAFTNRLVGDTWKWLLGVTHTCRHFRTVALEHPILWATITPTGSFPWNVFLSRSRGAALHVEGFTPTIDEEHVSDVIDNMSRIRVINIYDSNNGELWIPVLEQKAPELRILRLEGGIIVQHCLAPRYLEDFAPKLQHLSLIGVQIPWRHISSKVLRTLTLSSAPSQDVTLTDFLNGLANLPLLEELSLHASLPQIADGAADAPASVSLPQLRKLHCTLGNECTLLLFSCIVIPISCTVYLLCTPGLKIPGDFSSFLTSVKSRLSHPDRTQYVRLTLGAGISGSGFISLGAHDTDNGPEDQHNYLFSVGFGTSENKGPDIEHALVNMFVYDPLRVLSLRNFEMKLNDFVDVLPRFTALEKIEIIGPAASKFVYAFFQIHSSSNELGTNLPPPLPNLRTLVFAYLEFGHYSLMIGPFDGESLHTVLTMALKRRSLWGAGIGTLRLRNCTYKEKWMVANRPYVGVIDIDSGSSCTIIDEDAPSDVELESEGDVGSGEDEDDEEW